MSGRIQEKCQKKKKKNNVVTEIKTKWKKHKMNNDYKAL